MVLPAAAWSENDGTFANSERRVSRVRKACEPPGVAMPNWWIFREIAKRLGHTWASDSGREIWDDEEFLLVIKTREGAFAKVRETIRELHSYELPEVLCVPVGQADEKVQAWIVGATGGHIKEPPSR